PDSSQLLVACHSLEAESAAQARDIYAEPADQMQVIDLTGRVIRSIPLKQVFAVHNDQQIAVRGDGKRAVFIANLSLTTERPDERLVELDLATGRIRMLAKKGAPVSDPWYLSSDQLVATWGFPDA